MIVESQLRSAIQSHYLGLSSCLSQFGQVMNDVNDIKMTLDLIKEKYRQAQSYDANLGELKRETRKYLQLKAAKENVINIMNVDDLAEKAGDYLTRNKLLDAHNCIADMEKCRDEILEEITNGSRAHDIGDIRVICDVFIRIYWEKKFTRIIIKKWNF